MALAPTRRQAIICTNDGPGYRRIYALLELMSSIFVENIFKYFYF